MSTNMDEGLAVDEMGAAQTAAPDEQGHGDAPGPAEVLDDASDSSGSRDTPIYEPHQLGVAVDLPDEDDQDIGFE
ncbi:hypothetical protein IMZ48_47775 [Candidatus Bathyarchaeota archaeon]|nr:hypothetical protein [Candidatus Bathyarchaeota archaeon]